MALGVPSQQVGDVRMKMYIAGNTGTERRENMVADLGAHRLLSFHYIRNKSFGALKSLRVLLERRGREGEIDIDEVVKPS